jgi:hypothetical protein
MEPWRDQVRLVGLFHFVVAGLCALFSLFPAIYVVFGAWMLRGELPGAKGDGPPPELFGWIMIAIGSVLMLLGLGFSALLALAGRFLLTRRHWTFCLVMAAIACAVFPFGTVLGVFTILVLAKPEVKVAFGAAPLATAPVPPPAPPPP